MDNLGMDVHNSSLLRDAMRALNPWPAVLPLMMMLLFAAALFVPPSEGMATDLNWVYKLAPWIAICFYIASCARSLFPALVIVGLGMSTAFLTEFEAGPTMLITVLLALVGWWIWAFFRLDAAPTRAEESK